MLKTILYIALGGAIGSVLRYLTTVVVNKYWVNHFPLATFITNVLGCFFNWFIYWNFRKKQFGDEQFEVVFGNGFLRRLHHFFGFWRGKYFIISK